MGFFLLLGALKAVSVFQVDLSIFQENSSDNVGIFGILRKSTVFEHWNSVRNRYFVKKLIKNLHNFIAQS